MFLQSFYKKYNEYILLYNIKHNEYYQIYNANYNENINIFDLAVVLIKNYVIIVVRLYFLDWRGENGNLS